MKRKLAAVLLATLLAAAALAGCGGSGNTSAPGEELLEKVREKGKLTIAMEGTWAPWTYHDENDVLTGYDVEIGKSIARELGVRAEFVEDAWDGLLEGLDDGRYDLLINGVDATPERNEKYDFSSPYAYIHTVLVIRDDNEEIKKFGDLKGKIMANSPGSTYMEMGVKYGAKVESADSIDETMRMVISGRADATLNAEASVLNYLREHPDAPLEVIDATPDAGEVVIPFRKGDATLTLREAVNAALDKMRADGSLRELSIAYFGSDITNP